MPAQQQPQTPMMMLGRALGLDPSFVMDAEQRGQLAVIDRAQATDLNGGLSLVLSMTQRLGMMMQEKAEAGEPPLQQGALIEAIAHMADEHDVNKALALRLVGYALETFNRASGVLARGMYNELGTTDEPGTAGGPGGTPGAAAGVAAGA